MRKFYYIFVILLSFVLVTPATTAKATDFLNSINDIPLMQGLAELTDEEILFDKPDGRIIQTTAVGNVNAQDVMNFYDKTLPQLGWTKTSDNSYFREGETLALKLTEKDGLHFVNFTLSPQ